MSEDGWDGINLPVTMCGHGALQGLAIRSQMISTRASEVIMAITTITISGAIANGNDEALKRRVTRANEILYEIVGPAAATATGNWRFPSDTNHQQVLLELSDSTWAYAPPNLA